MNVANGWRLKGGGYDSSAQLFFDTAPIVDPIEMDATNRFVLDLKGVLNPAYTTTYIWDKFIAMYLMIGGTASTCSYNLINPSLFQITWFGNWIFSSTGAKASGTLGDGGDTHIVPATDFVLNDTHLSYYSGTQVTESAIEWGSGSDGNNLIELYANWSGLVISRLYNNSGGQMAISIGADSTGLFCADRTADNDMRLYHNGVQIGATNTNTNIGGLTTNGNLTLGNSGVLSGGYQSTKECRLAAAGIKGLTPTEEFNYKNAVQAFQTALGRAV